MLEAEYKTILACFWNDRNCNKELSVPHPYNGDHFLQTFEMMQSCGFCSQTKGLTSVTMNHRQTGSQNPNNAISIEPLCLPETESERGRDRDTEKEGESNTGTERERDREREEKRSVERISLCTSATSITVIPLQSGVP